MALNFRGTQRQLFNPSTVKYLDEKTARQEYAALRRIANRRAERLRASGYGGFDVSEKIFPAQSSLSAAEIEQQLLDVSRYLRDPRTTRPGFRSYQETMEESMKQAGMGKTSARDLKKFGDFMEAARRRAGGRLKGSGYVAQAYDEAVSRGMRPETLKKHFSEYLANEGKAEKLAAALYQAPTSGRLTIAQLSGMLS